MESNEFLPIFSIRFVIKWAEECPKEFPYIRKRGLVIMDGEKRKQCMCIGIPLQRSFLLYKIPNAFELENPQCIIIETVLFFTFVFLYS